MTSERVLGQGSEFTQNLLLQINFNKKCRRRGIINIAIIYESYPYDDMGGFGKLLDFVDIFEAFFFRPEEFAVVLDQMAALGCQYEFA